MRHTGKIKDMAPVILNLSTRTTGKIKDMAPVILNLSTRTSCVASITPRSQSRYWRFWRRSGLLPLPGFETTPSGLQLVATHIPTQNSTCLHAMLHYQLSQNAQSSRLSRCRFSHRTNDTNKNWVPSRHQSLDTTTAALCGHRLGIKHGRHTAIFYDTELGTVSWISASLFHN